MGNPVVFLDVSVGGRAAGRLQIELFADAVPRTAENFRQLCTGELKQHGRAVGYKNAPFHRVLPGFMVQGGDLLRGDGSGSLSIYGDAFPDESFALPHDRAGLLSMANSGPHTNGCQFFITSAPCSHLDGKHVVFGRVVDGLHVVRLIEQVPCAQGRPKLPVLISECGQMY